MTRLSYRIAVPDELIDDIRTMLSDKPEFNRLIKGTEFNDDQIKLAVRLWLNKFNNYPPKIVAQYTNLETEDFPAWDILFEGVMIGLLIQGGIVNTRNFLNFSDGGVSFSVNDKGQAYQSWINMTATNHERKVGDLKASLNAEEAYDYHSSPDQVSYYDDIY